MKPDTVRFIRSRLPDRLGGPLMGALCVFYLVFHALSGEHGIYALLRDRRELEILKTELSSVQAQNQKLSRDVRLMSPGSLDLDMLDEQSRKILGEAGNDEVVVPLRK